MRLLEARSDLFVIESVFSSFKKVDVTSWNRVGDDGGRITYAHVDVVLNGDMHSEGVRVQGIEAEQSSR